MGPHLINGIPAHVLYVHVVVVLVPLTALSLVMCAIWPSVLRRFGLALPLLALVSMASVPLTTNAGEWLEDHVGESSLVRRHAELGSGMLPWVIGLFVVSVAVWLSYRRSGTVNRDVLSGHGRSGGRPVSLPLRIVAVLVSLAVAGGAGLQVYRVGDSGAKAAWHGGYSASAHHDGGGAGAKAGD